MTAATRPRRTKAAKTPKPRKNQFDPEQLEGNGQAAHEGNGKPKPAGDGEPIDADFKVIDDGDADALRKQLAEAREQLEKLTAKDRSNEQTRRKFATQEARISKAEAYYEQCDAERKAAKAALEKEVAQLQTLVARWTHGEQSLPFPDEDAPGPAGGSAPGKPLEPSIDHAAASPITILAGKEIKKVVGDDEFIASKKRGEPLGLSEKQLDTIQAAGWETIGALEQAIRENPNWTNELKGFGDEKINRLISTLTAFRRVHPMPAEGESASPNPSPSPAAPPPEQQAAEWEQAAYHLRELLAAANEVTKRADLPAEGMEFAESVIGEATEMLRTIEKKQKVTAKQRDAIAGWNNGVAKWTKPPE